MPDGGVERKLKQDEIESGELRQRVIVISLYIVSQRWPQREGSESWQYLEAENIASTEVLERRHAGCVYKTAKRMQCLEQSE